MKYDYSLKVIFTTYDISKIVLDAAFLTMHVTLGGSPTKQYDCTVYYVIIIIITIEVMYVIVILHRR